MKSFRLFAFKRPEAFAELSEAKIKDFVTN